MNNKLILRSTMNVIRRYALNANPQIKNKLNEGLVDYLKENIEQLEPTIKQVDNFEMDEITYLAEVAIVDKEALEILESMAGIRIEDIRKP